MPVFPGGVVILAELFAALGIEQMRMADGALRDGLLYDMVGRLTDEDPRERTVNSMQRRYHVDAAQAARVEATALGFLAQVAEAWDLGEQQAELILQVGRAPARDRPRRRAQRLPPPRRLPAARTRTCPASRARSSCCSRAWSARTAASCCSWASRI